MNKQKTNLEEKYEIKKRSDKVTVILIDKDGKQTQIKI
jgi:hypothetical protein